MRTYPIEEIHSGEDDGCLWVSLGFASEDRPLDVLHIVCALRPDAQDRALGMAAIYLERDDQSRGGYAGADRIHAGEQAVALALNDDGRRSLEFDAALRLTWTDAQAGKREALAILARMSGYECGRVVECEPAAGAARTSTSTSTGTCTGTGTGTTTA